MNILNLLHLHKNIPSNSLLGAEIFKVFQVFLEKNLYSKSVLHRVEINAEVFLKILNMKTCITQEIRSKFMGIYGSMKEMAENGTLNQKVDSDHEEFEDEDKKHSKALLKKYTRQNPVVSQELKLIPSICKPLNDKPEIDIASQYKYLFADVEINDDISYGLRGYNRNIDRLSN
jgi:hypothetical protein